MKGKCPLCSLERKTEWRYEDERVVICRCLSHPEKWMVVLRRHTVEPTEEEDAYMRKVMRRLFPGIRLRGPRTVPHYHLHEV